MRDEDVFDEMALEFAQVMTRFFQFYPNKEHHLAAILADSLGGLLAIAAKNPEIEAEKLCQRLKRFPFAQVRAAHYGAINQVTDEVGNLRNFGPKKAKPK